MNAVEIEEALSGLSGAPFNANEFPFTFLQAFGNKDTTIRRLRARSGNASDVPGGVLQRNNIHLAVCIEGAVGETLRRLRDSPKTSANKAKFVLATDGITVESEELASGEVVACDFSRLGDQFGFFLPLAGISTVRQIKNNPIDVKATGRLNRLYIELLKNNPDWGTPERRHDLNQFLARLIFCFFAENTGIFRGQHLFTEKVRTMTSATASDMHEIISALFCAMDIRPEERASKGVRSWADQFPYVNGALFSGSRECPQFSRIARSYLLRAGELSWRDINPDIFGSMIQAVADDKERGALGLHYTSVPNILKVLNPLFLDDLREKLEEAGDNSRKLLNLRSRMARIRVFDPACGSGNFLVIAYKEMRAIEADLNRRRGEAERASEIRLTNFRGIELRDFPAEIARLALIIAEYQADVLYRGHKLALAEFLPLNQGNWITCGNALRLDWLSVCPSREVGVKFVGDDLFRTPLDQAEIDFEEEGGETYICGNPPYVGRRNQTKAQKDDIKRLIGHSIKSSASLDYVFCWIEKAANFVLANPDSAFAFVTTNSVTQGVQIPIYWPSLFRRGLSLNFAHRSFRWSNNAADNAGVTCVILGVGLPKSRKAIIDGEKRYEVSHINPYLLASEIEVVKPRAEALSDCLGKMRYGNLPGDGNYLTLSLQEREELLRDRPDLEHIIIPLYGAQEFIRGLQRFCLWIDDKDLELALSSDIIRERIEGVRKTRFDSPDPSYNALVSRSHQFRDRNIAQKMTILAPTICSETREYLPAAVFPGRIGTTNQAYALYDASLWNMALIASRLHLVWIATICGKLETRYRYSNTLGWNTFPVPPLTEMNKAELTRCSEAILLAREAHFPATIADLYDPEMMPEDLRRAHEMNDETLERIYIGRRFRNDTERLDRLFSMYAEMTAAVKTKPVPQKARATRMSAA